MAMETVALPRMMSSASVGSRWRMRLVALAMRTTATKRLVRMVKKLKKLVELLPLWMTESMKAVVSAARVRRPKKRRGAVRMYRLAMLHYGGCGGVGSTKKRGYTAFILGGWRVFVYEWLWLRMLREFVR